MSSEVEGIGISRFVTCKQCCDVLSLVWWLHSVRTVLQKLNVEGSSKNVPGMQEEFHFLAKVFHFFWLLYFECKTVWQIFEISRARKERAGECDIWTAFRKFIARRTNDPNELDDPVKYTDVKKIEEKLRICSEKVSETSKTSPAFVGLCQRRLDLLAQKSVAMKEIAEKVNWCREWLLWRC